MLSLIESHQPSKFGLKKFGGDEDEENDDFYVVSGGKKAKPGEKITLVSTLFYIY